jgi:hypothetical protein
MKQEIRGLKMQLKTEMQKRDLLEKEMGLKNKELEKYALISFNSNL